MKENTIEDICQDLIKTLRKYYDGDLSGSDLFFLAECLETLVAAHFGGMLEMGFIDEKSIPNIFKNMSDYTLELHRSSNNAKLH